MILVCCVIVVRVAGAAAASASVCGITSTSVVILANISISNKKL